MSDESVFGVYLQADGLPQTIKFEDATVAEVADKVRSWADSGLHTVLMGKFSGTALVVNFRSLATVRIDQERPSYSDPFIAVFPEEAAADQVF